MYYTERIASMISSKHEILWSVLCKKWGFRRKPPLFFIFILDQFHAKLTQKCLCFSDFFGIQKLNWLMVSWVKLAKIMKPHFLHKTDHKISCLLLIMDANLSCLVNIIDAIHNWNSSNHIYWYYSDGRKKRPSISAG